MNDLLTWITRGVAMLLVFGVGLRLFWARRYNGPLLDSLVWSYWALALTMFWYVGGQLLAAWLRSPTLRALVLTWAWVVWLPLIVTILRLWRALGLRR